MTRRPLGMNHRVAFLFFAIAAVVGCTAAPFLGYLEAITIGALTFYILYLGASCATFPRLTAEQLRQISATDDLPVQVIFLITLATTAAAVLSLFVAINNPDRTVVEFSLALLSVPLGWATVHMTASKHYAHLFWRPAPGQGKPRQGLEFPGTPEPDGSDFIYFAYVIGMTAQTSDVQLTGRHMRKFNVAHAMVSYVFNTVLVAAAVNVAMGN